MKFSILTIHPRFFDSFLSEALIAKALQKKAISVDVYDIRDFSDPPHNRVDDKPFGGGPGMILKPEPIVRALRAAEASTSDANKVHRVVFAAKGRPFQQKKAQSFSKLDHLILICGRYEGIDERVIEHYADEEIRIGNYVLMGGEVAAQVVVESVARLIPGVLGNPHSTREESFSDEVIQEYAQYTRPPEFEGHAVPAVLQSGNHRKIDEWRQGLAKKKGKKK